MNLRLDVFLHMPQESKILAELGAIRTTLETLAAQGVIMAGELARLSTEVTEIGSVVDSAITLINGLAQQIRDLATDPAALNTLADELDAKANALADAVVANTPTP